MRLTDSDIDDLYPEASVLAFQPEAVIAELDHATKVAASCFNLVEPPVQQIATQNTQVSCVAWRSNQGSPKIMLPQSNDRGRQLHCR